MPDLRKTRRMDRRATLASILQWTLQAGWPRQLAWRKSPHTGGRAGLVTRRTGYS